MFFFQFVHVTERDNLLSDLYETVNSSTSRCVLIEGESGCGKTKILRVLTDMCNKSDNDIVTIHIGEQLDSKVRNGSGKYSDYHSLSVFVLYVNS